MTKTTHGDAADVNSGDIVDWERTTLAHIHSLYKPEDIFNADEFGLSTEAELDADVQGDTEKCSRVGQQIERTRDGSDWGIRHGRETTA